MRAEFCIRTCSAWTENLSALNTFAWAALENLIAASTACWAEFRIILPFNSLFYQELFTTIRATTDLIGKRAAQGNRAVGAKKTVAEFGYKILTAMFAGFGRLWHLSRDLQAGGALLMPIKLGDKFLAACEARFGLGWQRPNADGFRAGRTIHPMLGLGNELATAA